MINNANSKKSLSQKTRSRHTWERKIIDVGQVIGIMVFLIVWMLDSFVFHISDFLSKYVPWWILILIATPIWIFAVYLRLNGMKAVFGGRSKEPILITTGVFHITRHPNYLSLLLVYTGLIISTLSLISFVLFFLSSLYYNFIANYEEKYLLETFGDKYREYQRLVPKWGIRIINRTNK
jgi:protein-S-isoprenylcysteine O-methyltransferase Ste14